MQRILLTIILVAGLVAIGGPVAAQEFLSDPPRTSPEPEARSWTHVRVTTVDDWHLDDVTVAWLANGARVRVTRADGTSEDYRPRDISKVEAADGTDLTAEIADARPAVERDPRDNVGTSRASAPVRPGRRTFTVAFTGGPTFGGYAGDWFEGYESGLGLQGSLRLGGTGGKGWFTLAYRRQGGGSASRTVYDNLGNPLDASVDLRVDEYMVMYGLPTKPLVHAHRVPYAEFGIVVMRTMAGTQVPGYGSRSDSATNGGPVLRLGGLIGVGEHGMIDLGVDIVHKAAFLTEGPGGTIFGAHAGFGYVAW